MAYNGDDSYINPDLVSKQPLFDFLLNSGQKPRREEISIIGGDWPDTEEDYRY